MVIVVPRGASSGPGPCGAADVHAWTEASTNANPKTRGNTRFDTAIPPKADPCRFRPTYRHDVRGSQGVAFPAAQCDPMA
ncbi:hypothetical protein GCM10009660_17540 [Catellatospora bangladeshensis]